MVQLPENRLMLPQITLCAVTSVNVRATAQALEACLEQIAFAECLLFTDAAPAYLHPEIRVVPIDRLMTSAAYSDFVLMQLVDYVHTTHCLVAQWDGHVLDARRWDSAFLDYDYIGASWPQFDEGQDVGNGGFSLRSHQLMELCRSDGFQRLHPEDIAIGQTNRAWLERHGMRFASKDLADAFSAERTGNIDEAFGYHGAFNMPRALGPDRFWEIYSGLDSLGTIMHDFSNIAKGMWSGQGAVKRLTRMGRDYLLHRCLRRR